MPANQILVVTKKGYSRRAAMEIAHSLNGGLIGYIDFINLYQIKTDSKNELQLREDLSIARSDPRIRFAFPHQKVFFGDEDGACNISCPCNVSLSTAELTSDEPCKDITATVTGCFGPFKYTWYNNSWGANPLPGSDSILSVCWPDTYKVVVEMNSSGCVFENSSVVTRTHTETVSLSTAMLTRDKPCKDITATVTGGFGPFKYTFYNVTDNTLVMGASSSDTVRVCTPDTFNVSVENTSSGHVFEDSSVVTQTHAKTSPLDDPIYLKEEKSSYRIVGVQQAWDEISSFRPPLTSVNIGVIDDGLYKGYGEFDGIVHIDTKGNGSLLEKPSSKYPIAGSHGTGIMNLIAADPDNGGLVGIASEPLSDNLTVAMINMDSPIYTKSGDAWFMGILIAICQAGMKSDIVSFSHGNSKSDPGAVTTSEIFFMELANTYPDHLFICSAGNEGKAIDGSRRFPYTYHLPNVVTVGCINNDGTLNGKSNRIGNNFEVTLAVPGDQAIWGKDDKGRIQNSGGMTSMSVPFVTSAAALIRSLDPSLNASSIKSILAKTARTSIDVEGNQVPAPDEVGGGVLAIDLAVQNVMANQRNSSGVAA